MSRTAIISVDGHVKASRAGYRDYVEQQYLDDFDRWLQAAEESGLPDAGNLNPAFGVDAHGTRTSGCASWRTWVSSPRSCSPTVSRSR